MKRYIDASVIAVGMILSGCTAPNVASPPPSTTAVAPVSAQASAFARLRVDGLYQSPLQRQSGVQYWDYLRFYPDGWVVIGASTGRPHEINSWFNREQVQSHTGRPLPTIRYKLEGSRVSFGFILEGRPIDFAATIGVDTMRIENFKPAPGQVDDPTLTFIAW
jgi:hypothetical protein